MNRLERIKGCLLGGAVGDALGAPVEFLDWSTIEARFGPQGIEGVGNFVFGHNMSKRCMYANQKETLA